jgi:serine/threonine protein kinase
LIGQTVSHYKIVEKLGSGGMGVVYKALDLHLNRHVALKFLPPEKTSSDERKRRFTREAKAASSLNHAGIVHIYDISSDDGVDYIAMEYVPGRTIAERIAQHSLGFDDAK